jgi:hypothetical protein
VKVGGSSGWSSPHYYPATSDPIVTMTPTRFQVGKTVTFRLPVNAAPCTARDTMLVVTDVTTNQDVSLFHFTRDADGTPHAEGMARYWLNSEGLAERIGGTVGNWGHRGLPGFTYQFDQQELVAGALPRRLKFGIPRTGPYAVFPMSDYERNRGGIIPEGAVMRIRPDIDVASRVSGLALVLARNFQDYGIVVGDNSGGNITVKGQGGVDWWTLLNRYDALSCFPVARDWEFIPAGWRP